MMHMFREIIQNFQINDFTHHFQKRLDESVDTNYHKQKLMESLASHHNWNVDLFEELRPVVRRQLKLANSVLLWTSIIKQCDSFLIRKLPQREKMIAAAIFTIIQKIEPTMKKIQLNLKYQLPFLRDYQHLGVETRLHLQRFLNYVRNEHMLTQSIFEYFESKEVTDNINALFDYVEKPKWKKKVAELKSHIQKFRLSKIAPKSTKHLPKLAGSFACIMILLIILNAIVKKDALKGEVLANPVPKTEEVQPAPAVVVPPTFDTGNYINFTIRPRDALWSISRLFGVSVDTIATFNGYPDPAKIKHGTTIKIPLNNSIENQILILAKALHGEARGEDRATRIAIAWVVKNRFNNGGWGNSITQVILKRKQFSCFNPWDKNYDEVKNPHGSSWTQAKKIAKGVLEGTIADPTGGALYYHNKWTWDKKNKKWKDLKLIWSSGIKPCYETKRLVFFDRANRAS